MCMLIAFADLALGECLLANDTRTRFMNQRDDNLGFDLLMCSRLTVKVKVRSEGLTMDGTMFCGCRVLHDLLSRFVLGHIKVGTGVVSTSNRRLHGAEHVAHVLLESLVTRCFCDDVFSLTLLLTMCTSRWLTWPSANVCLRLTRSSSR